MYYKYFEVPKRGELDFRAPYVYKVRMDILKGIINKIKIILNLYKQYKHQ